MVNREQLLNGGLNDREFNAFGGVVMIRDLTIKEVSEINAMSGEALEAMAAAVSYALVDPKMSKDDLLSLSNASVEDLNNILEAVTPDIKE